MEKSLKFGSLIATALIVVTIIAALNFSTVSTFAQNATLGNKTSTATSNATSGNTTSQSSITPKSTTSSPPSTGPGY
ncbi:MAG: hypothetical protein WBE34_11135 [Candidatus Nitrosopolaris sp.]